MVCLWSQKGNFDVSPIYFSKMHVSLTERHESLFGLDLDAVGDVGVTDVGELVEAFHRLKTARAKTHLMKSMNRECAKK